MSTLFLQLTQVLKSQIVVLLTKEISEWFCFLCQVGNESPKLIDHSEKSLEVTIILGCGRSLNVLYLLRVCLYAVFADHVSCKFDFSLGTFAILRAKGCTCFIKLFEYCSHSFVMFFLCFSMDKHVICDRNMPIQSFQDLSDLFLVMFRSRLDTKGHSVKTKSSKGCDKCG